MPLVPRGLGRIAGVRQAEPLHLLRGHAGNTQKAIYHPTFCDSGASVAMMGCGSSMLSLYSASTGKVIRWAVGRAVALRSVAALCPVVTMLDAASPFHARAVEGNWDLTGPRDTKAA